MTVMMRVEFGLGLMAKAGDRSMVEPGGNKGAARSGGSSRDPGLGAEDSGGETGLWSGNPAGLGKLSSDCNEPARTLGVSAGVGRAIGIRGTGGGVVPAASTSDIVCAAKWCSG